MKSIQNCRHCNAKLELTFIDLGRQPVANSFIRLGAETDIEDKYPLRVKVCESCWLTQLDLDIPAASIFTEQYAYFSSFSDSWLDHAAKYATSMIDRLGLGPDSLVIEIASNDGYLLKNFSDQGIPVLGVEPSSNVAAAAENVGVRTLVEFFDNNLAKRLVQEGNNPDLICAANVLAHVPDINNFVEGIATLLREDSIFTVEFPHLLSLIENVQFDTIYHEHYAYLSLQAVETIFGEFGLRVFDVEEISTHGGSLRVYACRQTANHDELAGVSATRARELAANLNNPEGYADFQKRADVVREDFVQFLEKTKREGKTVVAYGAAAKGNTFLNYCGVGNDIIRCCVDRNPTKQHTLLPGSRIPVQPTEYLVATPPDYVIILPWNLKTEIRSQLDSLRAQGTKFVTAIPHLSVSNDE